MGDGEVRVRLSTTMGDIVLAVDVARAPRSAGAFLEAVDAGGLADVAFARVVSAANDRGAPPIEVVQTLPAQLDAEAAGIPHESTRETGLSHGEGVVSLARAAPGTAVPGAFFICLADQPAMDHGGARQTDGEGFAVFGRVVEGLDVARRIHGGETLADAPIAYLAGQLLAEPVAIVTARREGEGASDRLHDLAEDYWDFRARAFPHEATAAGDRRFNDRWSDESVAGFARRAGLADAMLARARAIAPADLDDEKALTLALLTGQLETLVEGWRLGDHLTPRVFPFGFTEVPAYVLGSMPLGSARDFQNLVARLEAVPAYIAAALETLETGARQGYRLPRVLAARVRGLVEAQVADTGIVATVRTRFAARLPGIDEDEFAQLAAAADAAVVTAVLPAMRHVLSVLTEGEDTLCRDSVSICDQPDGSAYYRFKVRQQTTSDLDPDAIHDLGVTEVSAIRQALEGLLADVGFEGDVRAYGDHLGQAAVAPDAAALLDRARTIAKAIDGGLPRLFGRLPRVTYDVQSFSPELSRQRPVAMAQAAPGDRSLAGVFWLTALPERCPTYLLPALSLHEAWPGHLMQFALAHELDHLPTFRRQTSFDYNAYIEGWALYCERLGHDLGVYDDPRDRFGQLTFDLLRAARLVVDTGLHWKGWSREAAIDYLAKNSLLPADTIAAEVDRYIGMPAQALSYKIGEMAIRRLRQEAEDRLGRDFRLAAFHDAILSTGAVGLDALRAHIERWIEARCSPSVVA